MFTQSEAFLVGDTRVDLTSVESTLVVGLSSFSLLFVKLVPSTNGSKLALFYTSLSAVEDLDFLKAVRDFLIVCPSYPVALGSNISFARKLSEMPFDEDDEIDVNSLRAIAEERWERRQSSRKGRITLDSNQLLAYHATSGLSNRAVSMPPVPTGSFNLNSPLLDLPTIVIHSPDSDSLHASSPLSPASVYSEPPLPADSISAGNNNFRDTLPVRLSSVMSISQTARIALEIASHVTTLLSLHFTSAVPTYLPLRLAGLNENQAAQLYHWLQERYDYQHDISVILKEGASAEVIAFQIIGNDDGLAVQTNDSFVTMSPASFPQTEVVNFEEVQGFRSEKPLYDDIDLRIIAKPEVEQKPSVHKVDPNPLSYVFLSWLTKLMFLGNKKPLQQEDLYEMHRNDGSTIVDGWTDDFWKEYDLWTRDPSKKLPRLLGSIIHSSGKYLFASVFLWFLSICLAVFSPILIQQLIVCVKAAPKPADPTGAQIWEAAIKATTGGLPLFTPHLYALALCLFGAKIGQTICGRTADQLIRRVALNVKTALIGAVYRKSLRIGVQGIGRYEKGYILNLVNVDSEAISRAIEQGNLTWSIPVQIGMIIYLLYRTLGVSVWAGVGVLFGSLLALILVVPLFFRVSVPMFMRYGDKRMKVIKEILDGITLIKVRGWESLFLQRLENIRQTQLGYLRTFNTGVAVFVVIGQLANTLVPIAALSLFGKEAGFVTSAQVFPAISFFAILVEPLIALPQLLSAVTIAVTSWHRIYSFLIAEEAIAVTDTINKLPAYADPVRIVAGSFQWSRKADESSTSTAVTVSDVKPKTFIHDINISIKNGSLTAIVGSVGSGKSSILSAILGEMECVSGKVFTNGTVAYCPQQAWIQSTTVEDNIVFGKPYDERWLKNAVGAASFASDLERMPHGIASAIAERGANLSGGQKARLSIARAVYADADIVLLDDPLAALDPRVGRTVFNDCILGTLEGKTRILVTQALHFLPQVDHIIVVNDGTVVEQGSYTQLYRQNGQLRKMVDSVEKWSEKTNENVATGKSTTKNEAKVEEEAPSGVLVADEVVTTGYIPAATWWGYLQASGGWLLITAMVVAMLSQQAGTVMMNQWLTWWTDSQFHLKVQFWFGIYDGIGFAVAGFMICVNICVLIGSINASRTFHSKAFSGVISAPMTWFYSNPAGRVINRFSKDVESVDQRLMPQVFQAVAGVSYLLSTIVILAHSAPVILALLGPLMVIYYFLLRFYRSSLRELKRLESRSRSPLQSKVNETLDGIPTIVAYGRSMDFADSAHYLIDESNKPVFLRTSAEIWVTIRLELMSALVILAVAMLGKETKVMNTSQFGAALAYANGMTYILNLLVKASAAIESEMSSVERLQEYAETLPKDADSKLPTDPLEGSWPSHGEIVFKNVTAAYPSRPNKPVLRNVNIRISPGTTTFVVGRTGSGKSTMLSVMLRLLEIGDGYISIDGEDIRSLGVHTLRRGMELIPQDPFIFSGTIRTALDFENRFDDTSLWHALELVGLKAFVAGQEDKLNTAVADNGSNYSVGQRQLFCLAGAILRSPRILLLDEATASVDAHADAFLQRTMRRNCPEATILSVMHRLGEQVLKECDNVLVMDNGVPAEFDTPKALMSNPDSLFSQIMDATKH